LCAEAPELRRRIVLIDKARFPREKICAGAVGARADRLLRRIGVEVEVPSAPVAGLRVVAPMGELTSRLEGEPIGRVVRRCDFDAALLDKVRERGIDVREGVALRSMRRASDGLTLSTSAGDLRVRALVGADGVASMVRRVLELPRGEYHAQVVEVDTPWSSADGARDVLHFDVADRSYPGYAWDFPTMVNGERVVCRGVYELVRGSSTDKGKLDVNERLAARMRERGIEPDATRFKRFAERGLTLYSPVARERVVLVGEAAGIDPVLGEGIPQAIFYAESAARYLAPRLRAGDLRFGDYRTAMMRTRVGLDLLVRGALVSSVYGVRRPIIERWVTGSKSLGRAGLAYFSGRPVPRGALLGAAVDLARALVGGLAFDSARLLA
jgi:flavin-dependent dehydrogenase